MTATLTSSKRLYELTKWDSPDYDWWVAWKGEDEEQIRLLSSIYDDFKDEAERLAPAYSSGDLLERLKLFGIRLRYNLTTEKWDVVRGMDSSSSSNLAEALCLIAIKLREVGVI